MMGGIGSTIATGMAFGAGSEVAHQAVRSIMGGGSHSNHNESKQVENTQHNESNQQPQQRNNPCSEYNFLFNDCLKIRDNDISQCQSYFNDLKSCEKSLI
jgi:hypothetical protein